MDRQQIGRTAEDAAVAFLVSHGVEILERNFRRRLGEIDIVGRERDTLILAEVRMRASNEFGGAAASVNLRKQTKLQRAAALLLQQRPALMRLRVRFDVIAVTPAGIDWIKHAFT
jgi:putative endonuclease